MWILSPTTRRRVEMQGYLGLNDQTLASVNYGLRFGPAICTVGALVGSLLASSKLFLLLALVAGAGVFLPTPPLDWLYNVGVRHLLHTLPLPATSRPRRFACLLATLCLLAGAYGFGLGRPMVGYIFGGLMVVTPAILVISGFCVPSFLYGLIFGKPTCPEERSATSITYHEQNT